MIPLYTSIWDRHVKIERGYSRYVCYWDKTLSVSQTSSPFVHNILYKNMSKTGFCTVQKIGSKDMHLSPFFVIPV